MDREDKKMKRRLWKAVVTKDISWVRRNAAWVRAHPEAYRNRKEWTLVHQAVESQRKIRPGNHKMLQLCVEILTPRARLFGVRAVDLMTTSGLTPAHVAIFNNNSMTLQLLLTLGADVDLLSNLRAARVQVGLLEQTHAQDAERIRQLEAEQARSRNRAQGREQAREREDPGLLERALASIDPSASTPAELAALSGGLAAAARRVERETIRREVAAEAPPPPPPAEESCSICLDRVANMTFVPCGHKVTCQQCAEQVAQCPNCRAPIRLRQRTYG